MSEITNMLLRYGSGRPESLGMVPLLNGHAQISMSTNQRSEERAPFEQVIYRYSAVQYTANGEFVNEGLVNGEFVNGDLVNVRYIHRKGSRPDGLNIPGIYFVASPPTF